MTDRRNAHAAALAYSRAAATVPPSRAVVLLYDRVLVLLERAGRAIEERRTDAALQDVLKAAAILRGLGHIIDFQKGGALAERLYAMYTTNVLVVLQSFHKPDAPERYRRIAAGLAELRDAWATIAGLPTREQDLGARGGRAARPIEAAPRASVAR
ncbi:flagellar protein FliS [Rhodovulum sp. PH10]|uniref:flagellar export chaperone FliS n=1 Tax=Rhodovulum sp. PH10 TaxID=1187851 RepID=UPI00027C250A|nr:flagellar protein FliS [Rhodovulum sp. PH10]EJW11919.1 flagellar protein FliS [Rhodovulum sp. PH10]